MPEQTKEAAAKEAAQQDLSKLTTKTKKRGPGRPKMGTIEPIAVSLEDLVEASPMAPAPKRGPGRPKGSVKAKPGRPKKTGSASLPMKRGPKPKAGSLLKGYVKIAEARKIAKKAAEKARAKIEAGLSRLILRELKKLLK
jgi:hypothetical protein